MLLYTKNIYEIAQKVGKINTLLILEFLYFTNLFRHHILEN